MCYVIIAITNCVGVFSYLSCFVRIQPPYTRLCLKSISNANIGQLKRKNNYLRFLPTNLLSPKLCSTNANLPISTNRIISHLRQINTTSLVQHGSAIWAKHPYACQHRNVIHMVNKDGREF